MIRIALVYLLATVTLALRFGVGALARAILWHLVPLQAFRRRVCWPGLSRFLDGYEVTMGVAASTGDETASWLESWIAATRARAAHECGECNPFECAMCRSPTVPVPRRVGFNGIQRAISRVLGSIVLYVGAIMIGVLLWEWLNQ